MFAGKCRVRSSMLLDSSYPVRYNKYRQLGVPCFDEDNEAPKKTIGFSAFLSLRCHRLVSPAILIKINRGQREYRSGTLCHAIKKSTE
jgi:hypothetical protein